MEYIGQFKNILSWLCTDVSKLVQSPKVETLKKSESPVEETDVRTQRNKGLLCM